MNKKPLILLTGGGTAGHVTPHLALIPELLKKYDILYIGSKNGIEKQLIQAQDIEYKGIYCGKLRRYFSWENFKDVFKLMAGIVQATYLLHKHKPLLVFSKGGFVAVPVVIGAKFNKIQIICHESDITPGIATKISARFAKTIATSFPECAKALGSKAVYTGTPLRDSLYDGSKTKALADYKLSGQKPILLIMGGSQGALSVNLAIHSILNELLKKYDIIHLCGEGKKEASLENLKGYIQIEYLNENLNDVLACADIVVSRAGSNSIAELHALKKPMLLIPLPLEASRGDQILNAKSFETRGIAHLLMQSDISSETLLDAINNLYDNRQKLIDAMENDMAKNGKYEVLNIIDNSFKSKEVKQL